MQDLDSTDQKVVKAVFRAIGRVPGLWPLVEQDLRLMRVSDPETAYEQAHDKILGA